MIKLTKEEEKYLEDRDIIKYKVLEDGNIIGVMRLTSTYALLSKVGTNDSVRWFYHRYYYPDLDVVLKALKSWDGEGKPEPGYVAYEKDRDTI